MLLNLRNDNRVKEIIVNLNGVKIYDSSKRIST